MRRLALIPLAIAMLLFSPVASALGLGEIEMQSALNQRLDAEIPLRGVPEDERDRIIVSLASEEAFRQVGLRRPFSLTRLSFEIKQRPGGAGYIHVTSREPIVEPFLSFLIEVDWPEGNLLREYTVLLDPPVFVSEAPEQEAAPAAAEEAPGAETGSMTGVDIAPEVEPAVTAESEPVAEEIDAGMAAAEEPAAAEPRRRDGDFEDTPVFLQVEQAEERAEAEARALAEQQETEAEPETVTTTGYDAAGAEYGPIERGETLWNIASRLKNDQMTVQQMMLALLRYNPEAFVDDNINRLRQGYVLRIPDAEAVLSLSAQQAVARVREQNALWQEYRRTVRAGTGQAAPQQADAGEAASSPVSGADADLKIVGSEQGTGVGSDQEASATSGGSAQPAEDLKLAQERLESARMEKAELQSRVQELEETVGKMERLIELREDQLAQLQAQLQQIEQGEDEAAATETAEATPDDGDEAATEAVTEEVMEAAETGAEEAGAEAAAATDTTDAATAEDDSPATDADESGAGGEADDTAADEAATGADGTQLAEADTGGSAPTADSGGGATTVGTQPRAADPGILGTVMGTVTGIIDSIGLTVGGLVAGLGAGGLIPEPFLLPAAGAAVVLLLLLIMVAVRRRRSAATEEDEYTDTMADSVIAAGGDDSESDFSAMVEEGEGPVTEEGDAGLAETLAADETESGDEDAEAELMSEAFDLDGLDDTDETVSASAEGSEDETIAEADVYLAYGLHQQAEDLLKLAIEEQPDRLDYRAKLLEAIYADGRAEDFVEQARAMHGKVDSPESDKNWLRVVAMGKEMAPSEGLFQQEVDESLKPAAGGAAAPPETDLDLGDDDATDLDFSFDDEEVAGGGGDEGGDDAFGETMMLDSAELGEGAESATPAAAGTSSEEDGMDFDLGDIGVDAESETETVAGGTAESEEEDEGELDLGDFDLDEDEMSTDSESEMPDFGSDSGALATDLGETDEEPVASSDEAGEEADLSDLDLGSLDDEATGADTDTEESADEGSDFDFDLSEDGGDTELDLSDVDLGEAGEPEADEDSVEPEVVADADDDVSLDDLAADLAGDEEPAAAGGEETAVSASDDADDEYRTMLDLARAYIDMGDADSARSALEEVAEAGSDAQRDEAKSLLETI